jgi:nitroreductase
MHEQPWVFVVVQDGELLRRLSDRVKATWTREAAPAQALHVSGGSVLHGEFITRLEDPAFNVFYDAGTLVVICARRTDEFVVADCWLAAENLMLAAAALGLGTCCIGAAVPALNEPDIKGLLRIPADVHAVAPIVVGVPADVPAPAARREPEILSWK